MADLETLQNELDMRDVTPEEAILLPMMQALDAMGAELMNKRKEAIEWRQQLGVEDEWEAAQQAYDAEDEHNKGWLKPASLDGPFTRDEPRGDRNAAPRSKVYLNVTQPYVDAAAARIADMTLPGDEMPFQFRPTPLANKGLDGNNPSNVMGVVGLHPSEQSGYSGNANPLIGNGFSGGDQPAPEAGFAAQPPQMTPVAQAAATATAPNPTAPPGMPPMPGAPPAAAEEEAEDPVDPELKAAAKLAQKQIEDWLIECQWHSEVREVIDASARLGTGVLHGPYPTEIKARRVTQGMNGVGVEYLSKIAPASRSVSVWDCYPAPGCGDDIQNGSFFWFRDRLSTRKIREMMEAEDLGYIKPQMEKVLRDEQGKDDQDDDKAHLRAPKDKNSREVWFYYGMLERDELLAMGAPSDSVPDGLVAIPAIVTMIGDLVVKAALNPLENGSFPFDFLPWKRMPGMPYGRGVGTQMLTPQRLINAAAREMMENLGLSSGPQIVVREDLVNPLDLKRGMMPRKMWRIKEDVANVAGNGGARAQDVFSTFDIPSHTPELMSVINFALKMAEDITGLPALMQGQQGAAPDTVGGMTILNNNANAVLRRLARALDARVYEPHLTRYYEWLLIHGEDDKAKRDFQLDVRGSTVLVERELNNQAILQMANIVANPAFELDPAKWAVEAIKAQKMDPDRFKLSAEKKAEMANRQPPPDPRIEAAKIAAQGRQAVVQIQEDARTARQKMDDDTAREMAEISTTQGWQLACARLALDQNLSESDAKTRLFETTSKLMTQLKLAGVPGAVVPQVIEGAIEPVGRAKPGEAFQH